LGNVSFCADESGNDLPLDFGPVVNKMIMESNSAYTIHFRDHCLIDTTNTTTSQPTTTTKTTTTITTTVTATIVPVPTE